MKTENMAVIPMEDYLAAQKQLDELTRALNNISDGLEVIMIMNYDINRSYKADIIKILNKSEATERFAKELSVLNDRNESLRNALRVSVDEYVERTSLIKFLRYKRKISQYNKKIS